MKQTFRPWVVASLCVPLIITVGTGCSRSVKLGATAVHELQAVGKASSEVALSAEEVSRQSRLYGVSADAMSSVADSVDTQPGWSDPLTDINNLYRQSKDSKTVQLAVSVGCDGLTGKLTSQDTLYTSLGGAVQGLGPNKAKNFMDSTKDLNEKLVRIARTGNDQAKAAAAWLCYTYQNAP
jgi:hypothetical protein